MAGGSATAREGPTWAPGRLQPFSLRFSDGSSTRRGAMRAIRAGDVREGEEDMAEAAAAAAIGVRDGARETIHRRLIQARSPMTLSKDGGPGFGAVLPEERL